MFGIEEILVTGVAHPNSTSARVARRLPTSNKYLILPNLRQERSQGHHTTPFREETHNRLIRPACPLVCGDSRTAQRYLFRPSLTPIRTKYSTPSGDAGHNTGASYDLSFPLLPSSPPLAFAVTSQLESYLHSPVYDSSYTSPNGDPPAGHHLGCPFCHSSNKWHPLLHPGSLPL